MEGKVGINIFLLVACLIIKIENEVDKKDKDEEIKQFRLRKTEQRRYIP